MKIANILFTSLFVTAVALPVFGQTTAESPAAAGPAKAVPQTAAAPSGQPDMADMMKKTTEMMKLNENHKLLSSLDGTWNYTIKFWMDPSGKAQESKGTATRKSIMGGRYVVMDVNGKMQMPGEDGKMKDVNFKGMGLEGYDNVKQKFVASWVDNMGTGIEFSEGTYDPSSKTLTYTAEVEPVPGMKTPVREVIKIADKDHMTLEWYENQGGQGEKKTMEINYTRAGAAKAK